MKFDIIGKRQWAFLASGLLILISIIALVTAGLKPGIEFSSGSMLTVSFEEEVNYDDFKGAISELGYGDAIIQQTAGGDFLIRTRELTDTEKDEILTSLEDRFGTVVDSSFSSVSPQAASETLRNAIIAVLIASIGILLYITWAFRRMPKPFRYGTCAVIALIHDALVTLGIYAVLGYFFNWEINLIFITGILALIGYSVNNIVVIFDRIRENTLKGISKDFWQTVNHSVIETLTRSMNTSITTLIAVLSIMLFVGSTIQNFAVVLLIGIIVGTFDSIFVAPALLVTWDRGDFSKLIPGKKSNAGA